MDSPRWALALPLLLAAGCGSGAAPDGAAPETLLPAFAPEVTNAYFPVSTGHAWAYDGMRDGAVLHQDVHSLDQRRTLAGVACTGIEEHTYLDGRLAGITTEWFAQDVRGNVWKFGEEAFEDDGTALVRSPDSWVAGEGGARAWLAFPALPRVGQRLVGYSPTGPVSQAVVALDAAAAVPAGQFFGCVEILENPDDPADQDVILYAPGRGRVLERDGSGHAALTSGP